MTRYGQRVLIRDIRSPDIEQLVAINEAAEPGVTPADAAELERLVTLSSLALAAVDASGDVVGFAILMTPGAEYDSENFRWFEARGTDFLYLDRIAVAPQARDRGIGTALYHAVFAAAREQGKLEVTCEVNLDPPNPGSQRFHARLGFTEVGQLVTKGGAYTVSLLAARLPVP